MRNKCLVCGAPLLTLQQDTEMECYLCHKKSYGKAKCSNGHYICDACHMDGTETIYEYCMKETSPNPIKILNGMMNFPFCPMHGPVHHILVGSALLTAYRNAGGKIDLESALIEMANRAKQVPGGACGFWGACGAAVSTGMFVSIITGSSPLENEPFSHSQHMTSRSLNAIADIGGPRCCKRDSSLSILQAIEFVKENFGIAMESTPVICEFSKLNEHCIGKRCPFSKGNNRKRA